jgi:hypothetical protein
MSLPPGRQLTLARLGWRYDLQAGAWRHPNVPFTLSDQTLELMPSARWRLLVATMASCCPLCTRPLWP